MKRLPAVCGLLLLALSAVGCTTRTSAAHSWKEALAALKAGDAQAAEWNAELAAARGGADFQARRDFLFALTAYERSVAAEARAGIPGAAVSAYDRAWAFADEARLYCLRAIRASRADWPAARRNLERVMARLDQLQGLREAALKDPSASRPPPPPKDSPASGDRLLERLGKQEEQKKIFRRASANPAASAVEQDW